MKNQILTYYSIHQNIGDFILLRDLIDTYNIEMADYPPSLRQPLLDAYAFGNMYAILIER